MFINSSIVVTKLFIWFQATQLSLDPGEDKKIDTQCEDPYAEIHNPNIRVMSNCRIVYRSDFMFSVYKPIKIYQWIKPHFLKIFFIIFASNVL